MSADTGIQSGVETDNGAREEGTEGEGGRIVTALCVPWLLVHLILTIAHWALGRKFPGSKPSQNWDLRDGS